jgi:hypothetical protein
MSRYILVLLLVIGVQMVNWHHPFIGGALIGIFVSVIYDRDRA